MKIIRRGLLVIAVFILGLAPAFAEDSHIAVDFWGLAYHENRSKGYNEQNWGLGLRAYRGNWFVAVDDMKNSVRGKTVAVGTGYEYPVTEIRGYKISLAAEVAHVDYEYPGHGIVHGTVIIPFVSVRKGSWSGNLAVIPPNGKRETIYLFSLTYHLPSRFF